jgi:hypothetical protein
MIIIVTHEGRGWFAPLIDGAKGDVSDELNPMPIGQAGGAERHVIADVLPRQGRGVDPDIDQVVIAQMNILPDGAALVLHEDLVGTIDEDVGDVSRSNPFAAR